MVPMADTHAPAALDLDAWLPDAEIVTRHRREARTGAKALWASARGLRLDHTGTIGRLIRWRIPGVAPDESFMGLLSQDPFTVLDEGELYSISGLCGRIWTVARDYPRLSGPEDFLAWSEPRTVRVLFAHWVSSGPDGQSTLHSEARVAAVDTLAAMRLRALWLAVGPFERLIGAEPLALAATRAQSEAGPA